MLWRSSRHLPCLWRSCSDWSEVRSGDRRASRLMPRYVRPEPWRDAWRDGRISALRAGRADRLPGCDVQIHRAADQFPSETDLGAELVVRSAGPAGAFGKPARFSSRGRLDERRRLNKRGRLDNGWRGSARCFLGSRERPGTGENAGDKEYTGTSEYAGDDPRWRGWTHPALLFLPHRKTFTTKTRLLR